MRRQSQQFDIVITSGGVGPTHDDVTIKSVAEAFGQRMSMNPRMLRTLVHKVRGNKTSREREKDRIRSLFKKVEDDDMILLLREKKCIQSAFFFLSSSIT